MTRKPKTQIEDWKHCTQIQVAQVFGLTDRMVRKWSEGENPCPRNTDRTYDLPAVIKWYTERGGGSTESISNVAVDRDDAAKIQDWLRKAPPKARKEFYDAELKEMAVAQLKGRLVSRSQVHEAMAVASGHIRRAAESLQRRFGNIVVEVLGEALSEAQSEISNRMGEAE